MKLRIESKFLRAGALIVTLALTAAGGAVSASEITLTSLEGDARVGNTSLENGDVREGGEAVRLEPGARCSFLLGDFAVLHLSDEAELRFVSVRGGGPIELELQSGTLHLTVDGAAAGAPVEVRTPGSLVSLPSGIAELRAGRGTAATTVVAIEGTSTVSKLPGAETIAVGAGEQVTVVRGEAPQQVVVSPSAAPSKATARSAAVGHDRAALAARDLQAIAMADIPEEGLPLAAATSAPSALITELSKSARLDEPCDPITCNPVYQLPPPDPCGGIPGDHCLP